MIAVLLSACVFLAGAAAADQRDVTGTVRDVSGKVVPGAAIILRGAAGGEERTWSGPDGRFAVRRAGSADVLLIVRADGFAEVRRTLASEAPADVEVTLKPATLLETVTVTATRAEQRIADVAASVSVLGRQEIQRSPAVVADDVLRQIPTFSLFRRTSSLASHPTAQGVSLRGIGPSGVSRTLVLFDGIPFNDPFGGWVYWTRVPLGGVERIEIVDGANSSVYGNYAMGGVINIVPAPPSRRTVELRSQYGSLETPKLDISATDTWGRLRGSLDGTLFDTGGYPIVRQNERGPIDTNAAVNFQNVTAKLQYDFGSRVHAFVRGWHFREERANGKTSTFDGSAEQNDTRWTSASGGLRARLPDDSDLHVSIFADDARFRSNFLAVPAATPARSIGRMTLDQTVPSTGIGGMAQWARAIGTRQFFTAGVDWRRVEGESQESGRDPRTGTEIILKRFSGGTQQSAGFFMQDVITPASSVIVTIAARIDRWRSYDAHNLERTFPDNEPTANDAPTLPAKTDTVVSPRLSALYHVNPFIDLWGAVGAGFRAPTLNELYRQFRVGTVTTLANNQLGPERLVVGEVGVRITPAPSLTLRATWFDNGVEDAVSNVTLSSTGTNVVQQRQNLGRTRIRGIQTDAEYRVHSALRLSAAYVYNNATIREFDANPALEGNFLPQVPRHRATLQATYTNPRIVNISAGLQAIGRQFDDDQNIRVVPGQSEPGLPGFGLVDLSVSRGIARNVEVFGGVQNLLDTEYIVGTLPTTVGSPRLVHGGVRVRFAPR
jgi:outer membrane receptor protein involved in Fe transport